MRGSSDDAYINSIVGPGTFMRGHVELSGLLRIDGDFSGSVRTDGKVIVGRAGRADCSIEAGTVVIGGLLRGEILAFEKVVLLSSCVVLGSIAAPRVVVEEGVLMTGTCRVTGDAAALLQSPGVAEKRKKLLLESVRHREQSDAVRLAGGGAGSRTPVAVREQPWNG